MTTDRFTVKHIIFDGYCIVDNTTEGYYAYDKQDLQNLCKTLNELNDENKELKSQLIEKERMLDVRDKIIADVMNAINGDVE